MLTVNGNRAIFEKKNLKLYGYKISTRICRRVKIFLIGTKDNPNFLMPFASMAGPLSKISLDATNYHHTIPN